MGDDEPVRAASELGDETVPISAVHRADVLDDLVALGSRDALEDERGGVERHTERRRLVLSGHGGLDGLQARDDLDPVPVLEQLVKRMLLQIAGAEIGHERLADMQRLDRHRLAIGEP